VGNWGLLRVVLKMRTLRIVPCLATLLAFSFGQNQPSQRHFVPNAKAAMEIAETELIRVYGQGIKSERPFKAKLEDRIWTVVGTRRCQENLPRGFACFGGHWARLAKDDGDILAVGGQN
jgi:NTF2 fold immunity protein